MDKNAYNEKDKYYPILIKNQIKHENNKKHKDTDLKSTNKNMDKMIYFLSDKKERNSFTFFKTFIGNTDDISNDILNKKLIKVNTDNKSKSKNNLYNASCITNSVKSSNPKIKSKFKKKVEEDLTMNQKINKFESRIDNLLNVINDFEAKFINSPETQKIKEQFNTIMNKNIYKNKIINNNLLKSFNKNKTEGNNNDILGIKNNTTMDIKNINNINININNNNYENNYFITHSINDISHKVLNQKQNFPNKKFSTNSNNSILKKSNLKNKKKISKCNSNDLKNKTIHNYKDKSKLFKLPFDSITNNNNNSTKNTRYHNSYKDLQMPLTDRKEKDIEDNKVIEFNDLRNSLKNINKKKNSNCVKINKAGSSKNQIRRKNFIKKDGTNKVNLFKNKKQVIEKKNLTPSSAQGNPLINNTIGGGMDFSNKFREKEKSVNGSVEFIRMKKKENSELINYILNKRNIIKGNIATSGNNQHDNINNRDFINNKKNVYNKKK